MECSAASPMRVLACRETGGSVRLEAAGTTATATNHLSDSNARIDTLARRVRKPKSRSLKCSVDRLQERLR